MNLSECPRQIRTSGWSEEGKRRHWPSLNGAASPSSLSRLAAWKVEVHLFEMPIYQTTPSTFEAPTRASLKEGISEYRKSRKTRFVTDENIEPWALYVMRYRNSMLSTAMQRKFDTAMIEQFFGAHGCCKRVLVTDDHDFLDERLFPFSGCSGLLVLPTYGRVSLEFGNLLSAAVAMICRGREMWFQYEDCGDRSFVLKVRTWKKSQGRVAAWNFQLPRNHVTK